MSRGFLHLIIAVLILWFVYVHFFRKVPVRNK